MSGTFDLFNVMCKQHHTPALNSFFNGIENGDVNGICIWSLMVRLGSIYTERCLMLSTRKRSLGQGNAFTPVCHFVHRGGVGFSACITGHMTRGDLHPGRGLHPGEVSASGGYVSCWNYFFDLFRWFLIFFTLWEWDLVLNIEEKAISLLDGFKENTIRFRSV